MKSCVQLGQRRDRARQTDQSHSRRRTRANSGLRIESLFESRRRSSPARRAALVGVSPRRARVRARSRARSLAAWNSSRGDPRARPPARSTLHRCPRSSSASSTSVEILGAHRRRRAPPLRAPSRTLAGHTRRSRARGEGTPRRSRRRARPRSRRVDRASRRSRRTPRGTSRSTAKVRSIASGNSVPDASTPWLSRVMFIIATSGAPSALAMSRRVELLPQSKAAIASATNVLELNYSDLQGRGDELARRGHSRTRKIVREMRVQALHANAGAPDSPARLHEVQSELSPPDDAGRSRRELAEVRRRRRAPRSGARHRRFRDDSPRRAVTGSTNQNRVGIGVPSRRCGSFSITTGRPSLARTTTAKRPARGRPISDSTRC